MFELMMLVRVSGFVDLVVGDFVILWFRIRFDVCF